MDEFSHWPGYAEFNKIVTNSLSSAPGLKTVYNIAKLAMEEKSYASFVVKYLEKTISNCPPNHRLSILYFIDSICKTSVKNGHENDPYIPLFSKNLSRTVSFVPNSFIEKAIKLINVWRETKLFPDEVVTAALDRLQQRDGVKRYCTRTSNTSISPNSENTLNECPKTPKIKPVQ